PPIVRSTSAEYQLNPMSHPNPVLLCPTRHSSPRPRLPCASGPVDPRFCTWPPIANFPVVCATAVGAAARTMARSSRLKRAVVISVLRASSIPDDVVVELDAAEERPQGLPAVRTSAARPILAA